MRAGNLRVLVRLEQPVTTANPFGELVPTWTTVVSTHASKRVASGREGEIYDQRVASYDTEWRLRYRSPFDPRWRLVEVVTGTIHDIVFAADPDGRRREILCRTRIAEPQPSTAQVP